MKIKIKKKGKKMTAGWYVIRTHSNRPETVIKRIRRRIQIRDMEDRVREILIPKERIVEFDKGIKKIKKEAMFPGYILIRAALDSNLWRVIKRTSGVINFLGRDNPKILTPQEISLIKGKMEVEKLRTYDLFEIGKSVKVKSGLFADFDGIIKDVNIKQKRLKILISIFGRQVPLELNFNQVEKI